VEKVVVVSIPFPLEPTMLTDVDSRKIPTMLVKDLFYLHRYANLPLQRADQKNLADLELSLQAHLKSLFVLYACVSLCTAFSLLATF